MYQFDSTYDQEVPHMYPQVTQTFSRLETLSFPLRLPMILSIYSRQLSSRPSHLERKSCSPVERIRGHGENLSLDSQGKLRLHYNILWYHFFSDISEIVIEFGDVSLYAELFQDLCQMQEHWMIEGNYVNVKFAAS